MVPSRMREVVIAAAANATQASTPQTGSQTKKPSQPCASAVAARSAASRACPQGSTNPYFTPGRLPRQADLRSVRAIGPVRGCAGRGAGADRVTDHPQPGEQRVQLLGLEQAGEPFVDQVEVAGQDTGQ